ncbi:YfiR family protein [Acinetobacter stercoris]|uniref:YfiR family protein n=1 Tax=Acinetobacter stercoris TaxID=2126983 RepID=A0A2U3N4L5_9GAMM|nr:YfiR family protein [Acinetobacter stercoris]SPL72593.1 hypothetical protein KPC_3771 [Acinetobacter stercoris]
MISFFRKRHYLFGTLLFFVPISSFAYSPHNIYITTLSILSYVHWKDPTPNVCVVDNANATTQLRNFSKQLQYNYTIGSVRLESVSKENCDAVFFTNTSPEVQQQFLLKNTNALILSFSTNNNDCEIGSAFCLFTTKNGNTSFKINLDTLSRSRVHVDPRVLLLAKNAEN